MPKKSFSSRKKLTRRELRDLDVEISFLEGIVRRDPDYVEALQILGDAYTRRGEFAEGLKVDEQLARLRPDDALVHYNLACSYSLTEHIEDSGASLERALELGYRDFKWIVTDPDLRNLRAHSSYRKIRAKLRELKLLAR
jgi:tetratricopeptide (TPR) repeat protein